MKIKDFIEKAVAGGYVSTLPDIDASDSIKTGEVMTQLAWEVFCPIVFLDPDAWRSVSKVEGWEETGKYFQTPRWLNEMHRMVDALAEGKTIRQFIETI